MEMAQQLRPSRSRHRKRHRHPSSSSSSSSSDESSDRSPTRRSHKKKKSRNSKTRSRSKTRSPPPPPLPPRLNKGTESVGSSGESCSSKIVMQSIDSNSVVRDLSIDRTSSHAESGPLVVPSGQGGPELSGYVNLKSKPMDDVQPGTSGEQQQLSVQKSQILVAENTKVTKMSGSERIALAYKYDPTIEVKPAPKKQKRSSKMRGSDEEEEGDDVREKNPTSFPPSEYVTEEWFEYSKLNHSKTKKKVVYEAGDTKGAQHEPKDTKDKVREGKESTEVKTDALKDGPSNLKWTFQHHYTGWADMVELDDDIFSITKKDPKKPKKSKKDFQMELRLCKKEWQNIQLAQSHILNAVSHIQYYLHSSRQALNQVLCTMDIVKEEPNVHKLRDTKAMLKGLGYGVENICRMAVYTHAGISALNREQFLKQECVYIPEEVRRTLLGQPFGGNDLYNEKIQDVLPAIQQNHKEHHEKIIEKAVADRVQDKAPTHSHNQYKSNKGAQPKSSVPDPFPGQQKRQYNDDQKNKRSFYKKKPWQRNNNNRGGNQQKGNAQSAAQPAPTDQNNNINAIANVNNKK